MWSGHGSLEEPTSSSAWRERPELLTVSFISAEMQAPPHRGAVLGSHAGTCSIPPTEKSWGPNSLSPLQTRELPLPETCPFLSGLCGLSL